FSLPCYAPQHDIHSFPTRRSSDLASLSDLLSELLSESLSELSLSFLSSLLEFFESFDLSSEDCLSFELSSLLPPLSSLPLEQAASANVSVRKPANNFFI